MYIGIDLGTSAVKLLLVDEKGAIVNSVSEEYPLLLPKEGWSEQNPEEWYEKTLTGMKRLLEAAGHPAIDGIGVGGQMHGLVMLDGEDHVIRPAILWNDGRTGEETRHLNEDVGKDHLRLYTGNIAFAGFTAPKLLWVKEHESENFKRIKKIMLPKDYLVYRLTGAFTSDYSDASGTLLMDVEYKHWSKEMMGICDIKESMLPKLCESSDVVGNLDWKLKSQLGISGEAIVIAGAGDNAAAAVGTGTVGTGRCNISLGTSGTIFITSNLFHADENDSLHAFAHADGGYHLMGCMLSAASCYKWWLDEVLKSDQYQGEQSGITELGRNPVIFLPYLMGERSPHNDPDVRGLFYGLSMRTTRTEMTQSILEGVAFGLRDSFEVAKKLSVDVHEATICGGGAKSELWRRIVANVMGIRIRTVQNDEGPAMGGAILAMVGAGLYPDVVTAAERIVQPKDIVEPEPSVAAAYEERYHLFTKLYPAIKDVR